VDRQGVETILEMAHRIAADLTKLSNLDDAPTKDYLAGVKMVDLVAAKLPGRT